MTAKQKANQARFKKVVAEAKKLRAKNKKLTQAQAVKQAWAIMYSKTGTSKKVGAVKHKTVKKKAVKKSPARSLHKDTKSHNVRISVVSGFENQKNKIIQELKDIDQDLIRYEKYLFNYKNKEFQKGYIKEYGKISLTKAIKDIKKQIVEYKKIKNSLKKLI